MKRKAKRICEQIEKPVTAKVTILKACGEYVTALIIEGHNFKYFSDPQFNTALILMMNYTRGYLVTETILYNGIDRIVYSNWPPQLSLEFVEDFYNKKKPAI